MTPRRRVGALPGGLEGEWTALLGPGPAGVEGPTLQVGALGPWETVILRLVRTWARPGAPSPRRRWTGGPPARR